MRAGMFIAALGFCKEWALASMEGGIGAGMGVGTGGAGCCSGMFGPTLLAEG